MNDIWENFILKEMAQSYYPRLAIKICSDRMTYKICPFEHDMFRIFRAIPYEDVKIVILGQDPYYSKLNEANGFAFAVSKGVSIPPSLRNVFKEIASEFGVIPSDCTLEYLVKQGVFLLNTALTTIHGEAFAHGKLWQPFTDNAISFLNERTEPIVFLLWGKK